MFTNINDNINSGGISNLYLFHPSSNNLFKKKQSEYKYCKEFWGLTKKRELSENVFWDNQIQNTIEVYSETELTDQQTKTLKEVGVVY